MTFFAFGLNHQTAPVEVREAFALGQSETRALLQQLPEDFSSELVLVSTCNRTEVYLYGTSEDVHTVLNLMSDAAGQAWPRATSFALQDEEAVRHVLEVTSGLRSMVLGDAQILMQVKEAYRIAIEEDVVGTVMHRLMHTAFRSAKRVIRETSVASGAASVSSAAVQVAREHFSTRTDGGLEGRTALLVGTGQMGRLAVEALGPHRLGRLIVTNRSPQRAAELAEAHGAETCAWADRYDAVAEADLIIVATGAREPVLVTDQMPERAAHRPALLLDIAMPRNAEPSIDGLAGYEVIDLDALNASRQVALASREAALPQAKAICETTLAEFVAWVFHQQALEPAIHAIRDTFETIRTQEVERHHHRFSEADREELDKLTTSIVQKVLAVPVVKLKSVDPDSIDFVRGIKLLHALFTRTECDDASATPEPEAKAQLPRPGRSNPFLAGCATRCPFEEPASQLPRDPLSEALLRGSLTPRSTDEAPSADVPSDASSVTEGDA